MASSTEKGEKPEDWDPYTTDEWLAAVDQEIDRFPALPEQDWRAEFPCPRCGDTIVKDVPFTIGVVADADTIYVKCNCEVHHPDPNDPEAEHEGCGQKGHFQSPWTRARAQ